ncbi:polysaccharide biosynthesis tyrosine autokinase [bacterium]|nr:polysaccharide biosynthesis tyrosine autokinase [bacterium]
MDIRQVINMVKHWIWLLVLSAVVAGGLGYYISSRETPLYETSTRFVILWSTTSGADTYSYLDNQRLIDTYSQLLTTESLIEQASIKLGFIVDAGMASASQINDTQFIRLTVAHPDPEKAAAIANTLIGILIEQNEELQSVRYQASESNLEQRANSALEQIELLQTQLNDISISTVQEQLARVSTHIDEIQPQVVDLQIEINNLEAELALFRSYYATEEQIAAYEEKSKQLSELKAQADRDQSVLDLYQEIYTQLIVLQTPIDSGQDTKVAFTRIQSSIDLYRELYLNSIAGLEQIALSRAENTPNVVQVEPAKVPLEPISPNPLQTGIIVSVIGLVVASAIVFLIEYLDDTLKTPDEVKRTLGLPVLGLVADMPIGGLIGKKSNSGVFVVNQPRSPISEAFRSLRTNLEFASVDIPNKSLLVTSPGSEEGKTTVASNLAIVIAQNEKKVVLVDADLRRPHIHKQFDISNFIGLSDALRGKLSIDEVLQDSEVSENLSIVTSGVLPPNPVELLASQRMEKIVSELKERFDIVIFDTPPMLVTDAQVLSTKVDGTIFVIRPGKTRTAMARAPLEELRRVHSNILGVVMNRIPKNREYYFGGLKFYSPYTSQDSYHLADKDDFFSETT